MTTNHSDVQGVICKCKDNGCLLLVLVYDDESCNEITIIWNSQEVTSVINAYNKCETLQLSSGSMEFTNFAKQYPVIMIPSVFIINDDGIPLDMLYGSITTKELAGKINRAIEAHKSGKTNLVVRQRPLSQKNSNTAVKSVEARSAVLNQRRTAQRDKINYGRFQQTTNSSTRTTNTNTGNVLCRDDVNIKTKTTVRPAARYAHHQHINLSCVLSSSTTCRLQLKVANSNNKMIQQFQPSDTLSFVKECASKGLGIPLDAIILEKSYPAYRFGIEDDVKSLSELQLIPTAMLIVKQKTTTSLSYLMLSRIFETFFYLLSIVLWPLKLLGSYVLGSSANNNSSSSSNTRSQTSGNSQPSNWKDSLLQTRRRGNITSFKQDVDDDDDQNTYNGNSTQQQ